MSSNYAVMSTEIMLYHAFEEYLHVRDKQPSLNLTSSKLILSQLF